MQMSRSHRALSEVLPVMAVKDGFIISKRGDVTLGWELSLPVAFSMDESGYDDVASSFASAVRLMPPWTMVHRQDVFLWREWRGETGRGFLSDAFSAHFEGRRYLEHRQFLWLTMSSKASALKSAQQSAAFGIRFSSQRPTDAELRSFAQRAGEFVSVLTGSGRVGARRLTQEEIEGDGMSPGLIDSYLTLGGGTPLYSDLGLAGDSVAAFDREVFGFKVCDSERMPGEVPDAVRVDELSTAASELVLSYGSPLGIRLGCEHVVNQYVLLPAQDQVLQDLDRKRRRMVSMSTSAENRVNAEQVADYIDDVQRDSLTSCYSHLNVLAWCPAGEARELRGKVSAALSSMGVVATQALYDLPVLFLAGVPGGACELSRENLMLQELTSMACMGLNETFDSPLEGGGFLVVDRLRHVPIAIDIQRVARSAGLIDNYNVFLLGPSGSGKSFFTNFFLRQCYDAGEHIFVIDVGDSYQGLCQVVNEQSGGRDGFYMSWDVEHPFSFNPFVGWRGWTDADGSLRQDDSGVTFFLSFLTAAWRPAAGWTSDAMAVLERILADFLADRAASGIPGLPVFDDFYRFLGERVVPRIVPVYGERGEVVAMPSDPLVVAYNPVRPEDFDIVRFMRALVPYSAGGGYAFLLNDREPRDLFASRFTVFEVQRLSQGNPLFYSLCVLCIMNAFEQKMQGASGFKRIVVDEAWKAIANETMAPYLKGLWKTARKYQTSAMVVTQELDDIVSSEVIKEAILQNSDTKVLLNQSRNANRFGQLASLMGLGDHQRDLILSIGLGHVPEYLYTDVYIGMNGRCGVYSIEASLEEALAYESDKVRKQPLLDRARELGSMTEAIRERAAAVRAGGRRRGRQWDTETAK